MNTKPTVTSAGAGQTARRCEYPMLLTADALRAVFVSCADFQMRALSLGLRDGRTARVCWLDGLVDGALGSETISRPLTSALRADGGGRRAWRRVRVEVRRQRPERHPLEDRLVRREALVRRGAAGRRPFFGRLRLPHRQQRHNGHQH
jgi:hypothetical protein